jgi:alcohol dehydrogenase class IV
MAAPALHLTVSVPVAIELMPGWHEQLQPQGPFVVLADPAAIDRSTQARWQQAWGALCLDWVEQAHRVSSLGAAQTLAERIWPLLSSSNHIALWAIGGGTTMDLGKLLRWRMPRLAQAQLAWRDNAVPEGSVRHSLWCSPTTAGTGSEVTPWATVWDLNGRPARKRSWYPPSGHPDRAWVDSQLTLGCPTAVRRDCALDALSHALESLWNRQASQSSRPVAKQAARMILRALPAALQSPQEAHWREQLAEASLLAGLAMAQTQTALAHALSYELTLSENIPHGQACAIWLPMTMALACRRSEQVCRDLQEVFDEPPDEAMRTLHAWLVSLGIAPRDLNDSPAGQILLADALNSDRGRNFVAQQA